MLSKSNIGGYYRAEASFEDSDIVIVGIPMDYTVSYRPGTRFGPNRIREVSYGLENYSPYLDRDITKKKIYDYGDLELPFGNVEESLRRIGLAAKEVFDKNKKPFFLGGEHLVSSPIIYEAYNKYGEDLILLHFDAHTDLRDTFFGEKNSHANVIKHASYKINPKNIFQFGIRSGSKEEFVWAKENSNLFMTEVYNPVKNNLSNFLNRKIYITLDIDVFDPAFAPGTGTPESGGCTPIEMIETILLLKDLDVVGMDIVEVSPPMDTSDITSVLAAKIMRESILSFM